MKPEPISVDFKDVNKLIYAGHFLTTIFELEIDGRKERVLPRDYQLDVVTDRPVHVDFLRLTRGLARPHRRAGPRRRTARPRPASRRAARSISCATRVEVLAPADTIPEAITIDLDRHGLP